eukprot:1158817-Pelagomonas_calceolata.AAC.3
MHARAHELKQPLQRASLAATAVCGAGVQVALAGSWVSTTVSFLARGRICAAVAKICSGLIECACALWSHTDHPCLFHPKTVELPQECLVKAFLKQLHNLGARRARRSA